MLISNKIEAHLCGAQTVHGEISQANSILKILLPLTQNNLLTDHQTTLMQGFNIKRQITLHNEHHIHMVCCTVANFNNH